MISTLRETDDADETTQLVSDCANLLNDAAPATTEAALDVRQELREKLEGEGQERPPTEDEVHEEVKARQDAKKMAAELSQRRVGTCNKVIVDALEKLRESSIKGVEELALHERVVSAQVRTSMRTRA